jgi:hypothetical protein
MSVTGPEDNILAHIDESGDTNLDLDKEGTSKYYTICALVVRDCDAPRVIASAETIRDEFCGKGELKSSNRSLQSQKRRLDLLERLLTLDMKFYALAVNKENVDRGSGLRFKRSFIKNLHRRLYEKLFRAHASLTIRYDEHGSDDFMSGFETYMRKHYPLNFLQELQIHRVNSRDHVLIQVADLIAGTVRRYYEGTDDEQVFKSLAKAALVVEQWPPSLRTPTLLQNLPDSSRFDHIVEQQSISRAMTFIAEHGESEESDVRLLIGALQYLLFRFELDPDQYVPTHEINEYVTSQSDEVMSNEAFRSNVIAPLRDKDILIASSNKGYKLPRSAQEMDTFVALVNGQAIPYMERLRRARAILRQASMDDFDIVDSARFPELAKYMQQSDHSPFDTPSPNP